MSSASASTAASSQVEDVPRWYSLPWESSADTPPVPLACRPSSRITPGELVLRTLLAEFTSQAARKLDSLSSHPLDRPLARFLQAGEDVQFDQTLLSLSSISEHCLPSVLRTVLDWYNKQMQSGPKRESGSVGKAGGATLRDHQRDRRDLCVDFLFCRVLIEVLTKLSLHPSPDVLMQYIIDVAFKRFKERNLYNGGPNCINGNRVADLYAEVVGVLSQPRFSFVRARLKEELAQNPSTETTINLVRGMSFVKVKMYPVEALEEWFRFLKELGNNYLLMRDKDVKHAFSAMFVEILGPVAAAVKLEVNLPACKSFVEMMYTNTYEMAKKARHAMAAFPLVTILLSISQKTFFLANWHHFLTMCLTNLRHRDVRMQRVSLDSIYRLLWVYMIRIKCESNTATQSRLRTIVESLFPRGSRSVVPRDTSLTIFVKIVHFIAQEKLDFAMQEIIFELLSINQRSSKTSHPERTNIGLRAFLVIIDSLEKSEGAPPMPPTVGIMPSGNTLRTKKHFLNTVLTDQVAKKIGIFNYYQSVRRALDRELQALDLQVGRQLVMTNPHWANKDLEEVLTGDRKPKIELYRTCVAAVPRCIPEGVARQDLIDHLSRLTIHLDSELRGLAFTSLQTMIMELPDWREDVIKGFVNFMNRDVPDSHPHILESELRCLVQFLTQWKAILAEGKPPRPSSGVSDSGSAHSFSESVQSTVPVLQRVEGFALTVLCSTRPTTRKLAMIILKEVRHVYQLRGLDMGAGDTAVMSVIEKVAGCVVHKCLSLLPEKTRNHLGPLSSIDMVWLAEQPSNILGLSAHSSYPPSTGSAAGNIPGVSSADGVKQSTLSPPNAFSLDQNNVISYGDSHVDLWSACLAGLLEQDHLPRHCPKAVQYSWPSVFQRLMAVYSNIDPGFSVSDPSKGSMRSMKKPPNPGDLCLWHNYLVYACCVIPPAGHESLILSSMPSLDPSNAEKVDSKSGSQTLTPAELFHWLGPLVRCELPEIREAVVTAFGYVNPLVFSDLVAELQILVESIERGKKKKREKRDRDPLRLHVSRIYSLLGVQGSFRDSPSGTLDSSGNLLRCHAEYIETMRVYLLQENEKAGVPYDQMRRYFCTFISDLVGSVKEGVLTNETRADLFFLFGSWCGQLSITTSELATATRIIKDPELHAAALKAICALLCCGPIFNSSALEPHGYLLRWVSKGLERPEEKTQLLIRRALEILMVRNTNLPVLLDWIIDKCYTGSRLVVDGCFHALARSFCQNSDYPCDMVAVLNVTLFMTADSSHRVRERAAQLLQVLERRFFSAEMKRHGSIMDTLTGAYSQWQLSLSTQLASRHPELSLPMYSEMCMRLENINGSGQQRILQYMVPWLRNIELEMSSRWPCASHGFPKPSAVVVCEDSWQMKVRPPSGYSSVEATEMVLNNLFYITVKYDELHAKLIEQAWASLCSWHYNIPVALTYVIMLAGYSGSPELLHHAKKVVVFLGRTAPNVIIGELLKELESMDPLSATIEQSSIPPYYNVQPRVAHSVSRNSSSCSHKPSRSAACDGRTSANAIPSSRGQGVVKRRYDNNDPAGFQRKQLQRYSAPLSWEPPLDAITLTPSNCSNSLPVAGILDEEPGDVIQTDGVANSSSLITIKAHQSTDVLVESGTEEAYYQESLPEIVQPGSTVSTPAHQNHRATTSTTSSNSFLKTPLGSPYKSWSCDPLPMPHGGGYFAPLTDYLLPNTHTALLYRSNFALMLLTELVVDRCPVQWSIFLPKLLHMAFLGLDHVKPLVYEHCKRLLTNLVLVLACEREVCSAGHYMVASGLRSPSEDSLSSLAGLQSILSLDTTRLKLALDDDESSGSGDSRNSTVRTQGHPTTGQALTAEQSDVKAKRLIEYITLRERRRPLWSYEEITSRVVAIKSAEHLEALLSRVMGVVSDIPGPGLSERWAKEALRWATYCSSRHYAGRSFQLCRALRLPISWSSLVRILMRLCDSAADASADVQGYAVEIFLTLEAMLENDAKDLLSDEEELSSLRSAYKDTWDNLFGGLSEDGCGGDHSQSSTVNMGRDHLASAAHPTDGHDRRLADAEVYKASKAAARAAVASPAHGKSMPSSFSMANTRFGSPMHEGSSVESTTNLTRVTSSSDSTGLQCRIFWIAVALLESDYEHEFLFGLRLLGKVMDVLHMNDDVVHEGLMATLHDSGWPNFPGVQSYVLKGLTSTGTFEPTVQMLCRLTEHARRPVIDVSTSNGLAINIIALLPYLSVHFTTNNLDDLSLQAVTKIIAECQSDSQLSNLGKLFDLYLSGQYTKTVSSWIHSVCLRLREACPTIVLACLPLLTGLLIHCDEVYTSAILSIIGQLIELHALDLQSIDSSHSLESRVALNQQIIRIVSSFVQGNVGHKCSSELRDILQLAVQSSAKIAQPASTNSAGMSLYNLRPSELPGPSLEVKVELTKAGRVRSPTGAGWSVDRQAAQELLAGNESWSNDGDLAAEAALNTIRQESVPGWKRPQLCQSRVRDRLACVLKTCVTKNVVTASPSVIFNSDLTTSDVQAEISSTEDVMTSDSHSMLDQFDSLEASDQQLYGVLREFDFLDDLEGGEDSDNVSVVSTPWGSLRRHLSLEDITDSPFGRSHTAARTPSLFSSSMSSLAEFDASPPDSAAVASSPTEEGYHHGLSRAVSGGIVSSARRLLSEKMNRASSDHDLLIGHHQQSAPTSASKPPHPAADRSTFSAPSTATSSQVSSPVTSSSSVMAARHFQVVSPLTTTTSAVATTLSPELSSRPATTRAQPLCEQQDSDVFTSAESGTGDVVLTEAYKPVTPRRSSPDNPVEKSDTSGASGSDSSVAGATFPASAHTDPIPISATSASISRLRDMASSPSNISLPRSPSVSSSPVSEASLPVSPTNLPLPASRTCLIDPTADGSDADADSANTSGNSMMLSSTSGVLVRGAAKSTSLVDASVFAGGISPSVSSPAIISPTPSQGHASGYQPSRAETGSSPELFATGDGNCKASSGVHSLESLVDHGDCAGSEPESSFSVDHQADGTVLHHSESESSLGRDRGEPVESPTRRDLSVDDGAEHCAASDEPDAGSLADSRSELSAPENVELPASPEIEDVSRQPSPLSRQAPPAAAAATGGVSVVRDIASPLSSEFLCIPADEVDEVWRAHVSTVIVDTSAAAAVNSMFIFTRLFKSYRRRLAKLTRDACHVMSDQYSEICGVFLRFVDVMQSEVTCPYIYIETEVLLSSSVFDHFKFCLIEMNENILSYTQRRDAVLERLDGIRVKLRRSNSTVSCESVESTVDASRKDFLLLQDLYRLHFQLLMLLDTYTKMLDVVHKACAAVDVSDLSSQYTDLVGGVLATLRNCEWKLPEDESFFSQTPDPYSLSRQEAIRAVREALACSDAVRALQLVRFFRNKWPMDIFGSSEDDDADVLVLFVAKSLIQSQNSTKNIMVYQSGSRLGPAYSNLMKINMDAIQLLKAVEKSS